VNDDLPRLPGGRDDRGRQVAVMDAHVVGAHVLHPREVAPLVKAPDHDPALLLKSGRGSRDAAKEFVASWAQPGKRPTVKTTRVMIMKLLSTKRIEHVNDGPVSRAKKKLVPISQK
jgi:hypothetical protein